MAKSLVRRGGRRVIVVVVLTLVMAILAMLGFGLSGPDEAALRTFSTSVERWQSHPEFRTIAIEYCKQGSAAAGTDPWGIPTRKIVLTLRSLPLLPKKYAA